MQLYLQRTLVARELVETERSYVAYLLTLIEVYLQPMLKRAIITDDESRVRLALCCELDGLTHA